GEEDARRLLTARASFPPRGTGSHVAPSRPAAERPRQRDVPLPDRVGALAHLRRYPHRQLRPRFLLHAGGVCHVLTDCGAASRRGMARLSCLRRFFPARAASTGPPAWRRSRSARSADSWTCPCSAGCTARPSSISSS